MTALAKKEISDSPRRMGRPRLDKTDAPVMVPVRFTPDTLARIEAAAGKNHRAEFIRLSVEAELARREKG